MRSKLLIISLFVSLLSMGQKLPITGLCLSDVLGATGGACLATSFTNANSAYFDPAYAVTGGNWLDDFRNYGAGGACTRPTGLTNTAFWYAITINGVYSNFTGSFTAASQALYDQIYLQATKSMNGATHQVYSSLAVGDTVYSGVSQTDCSTLGSGYYLVNISSYPQYVFYISEGKITSKTMASISSTVPTVTTTAASSIAQYSATLGGNVTADGGTTVTARGIVIATTQNPTTNPTSMGSGLGIFGQTVGGLSPGILYYVRAYAINSAGTAYGTQVSFTTSATTPSVSTDNACFINVDNALIEGTVSVDGGATVTARGFCYSTSNTTPTTADSVSGQGSGTGYFSWSPNGLPQNTNIYIRAYATNSAGTSYGTVYTIISTTLCN